MTREQRKRDEIGTEEGRRLGSRAFTVITASARIASEMISRPIKP